MTIHTQPTALDSIKKSLVGLKMPRALEMLDATLRRVEQGEITRWPHVAKSGQSWQAGTWAGRDPAGELLRVRKTAACA